MLYWVSLQCAIMQLNYEPTHVVNFHFFLYATHFNRNHKPSKTKIPLVNLQQFILFENFQIESVMHKIISVLSVNVYI